MPIEIVVGLPHLSEGPIVQRARRLQVPALISANCLSRWDRRKGWPEWLGWKTGPLQNAVGLRSLDLDSGGFVCASRYGGIPWTVDAYMMLAASYPFRRIASLDYCVEQEIARDREEVLDRLSRTIRTNRECRARAEDQGIADRFMPVIQGRAPVDYERVCDALALSMVPGAIIGVGSMCRRAVAGPEGLIAVFEYLDRILPTGVRLHGFGVKGTSLSYLKGLEHRIASIDSQAYGIAARQEARKRGASKTNEMVADHLEAWTAAQIRRARSAASTIQCELPLSPPAPVVTDRWEAAIAQARQEIRDLIESGDLDHDEVTAAWVEEWAADLYAADA